jgi:bifunctional non-homologous end joining protein LigD
MTSTPSDETAVSADEHGASPARRARMPDAIRPMLATEAREAFDSPDYVFEAKWGGVRAMAHIRDDALRLRGRNGRDLAPYFPELIGLPDRVQARDAIVDGEIVGIDGEGHSSFDLLRPRLHLMADDGGARPEGEPGPPLQLKIKRVAGQVAFQAFDLLWLDGRSLIDEPLWHRKSRLADIVMPAPEFAAVDFVDDEGVAFFDAMLARRMEGVVAKQKQSPYVPGLRSRSWLDVRALQSGDFVVGGYTIGGARRRGEPFSQLLLGGYADGRFEFVGAVSGGLRDAEARELVSHLEPLHVDPPPFFDAPPIPRLIYWTRPEVVCHVRFSEWTREGHLRFPIFSALRPDLAPEDCVVD